MDCFRDSFVGHTIRVISRRRLLQYPEERDPSRWKAYIRDNNALEKVDTVSEIWLSTLVSQTRSQQRSPGSSNASDVGDLEKSKDVTIITWADDNDQGVGVFPSIPPSASLTLRAESAKLGLVQKVLRKWTGLLDHVLDLHRFRHLYTVDTWHRSALSRQ
jgi:hypothetical protein